MAPRNIALVALAAFAFYVVNHLRVNRNAALENLAASERAPAPAPRQLEAEAKFKSSPLLQFKSVEALTIPVQGSAYAYDRISQGGRVYTTISAYTNPASRAGATLTLDVRKLLRAVLADPKVERLTVNYQMDDQRFSGVYTKAQLDDVLKAMER